MKNFHYPIDIFSSGACRRKTYAVITAGIIMTAGLVYFLHLGKHSLSAGEYFNLYLARQSPRAILSEYQSPLHPGGMPPAYALIMHYWLNLFGAGEYAQRSFSALCGVLSIYMLLRLGTMLFDAATGVLSAGFGLVSFLWFSLFCRNGCYGLFILLALASFYAFFYFMGHRSSLRSLICLTAANILLAYTHYFGVIVILIEAGFAFSEFEDDAGSMASVLLTFAAVVIAYLPWLPNLLYDVRRGPFLDGIGETVPVEWNTSDYELRDLFSVFHAGGYPVLMLGYLPILIRGLMQLRTPAAQVCRYLIVIAVFPFIAVHCVSIDRVRYYAPFSCALILILARGARDAVGKSLSAFSPVVLRHHLVPKTITRRAFIAVPVFIVAASSAVDFAGFFRLDSQEIPWREASDLVRQVPAYPGRKDVFIFQKAFHPPVFAYYYQGEKKAASLAAFLAGANVRRQGDAVIDAGGGIYICGSIRTQEFHAQLAALPDDVWIWIFGIHDSSASDDVRRMMGGRYFVQQINLGRMDVFLLKKIKGEGAVALDGIIMGDLR